MAISPILLAGLAGAGGSAIGNLPTLIKGKGEKEAEKRLAELRRMEEMNALGLSDQERSVLSGKFRGRSEQAGAMAEAERNRLLAGGGGVQAGAALEQAVLADETRARREDEIQMEIERQDLAKQDAQREDIRALESVGEQYRQNRLGALAQIGGTAIGESMTAAGQEKLMRQRMEGTREQRSFLMKQYGLTEEEAQGAIQMAGQHGDDFFKTMSALED